MRGRVAGRGGGGGGGGAPLSGWVGGSAVSASYQQGQVCSHELQGEREGEEGGRERGTK